MQKEENITFLMLEHHKYINKLLDSLIDGFGMDKEGLKKTWDIFKQKIEKHMQTEEQVIFSFSDLGTDSSQVIIRELLTEHGQIRRIVDSINKDFEVNFGVNIIDLQRVLLEHESKENDVFYPKLDLELDDHGRRFILSKIKTI